jgi:two-component system sensor histidine kinase ChvG
VARISIRLLAFNVLLVFLPVAGLFYLDVYETQLRRSQERSMVQQGRILAAALGAQGELRAEGARRILEHLEQRTSARLRILDADGFLLADSSVLGPRADAETADGTSTGARESWLYRLGALPFRLWGRVRPPERVGKGDTDYYSQERRFDGVEVRDALAGRYGATTRISPAGQLSVTFYSAIPIRIGDEVAGAVLVSQSTLQILQDLYEVRLQIFAVFLASVAVAVVLSLLVSTTIARPLQRLRRETADLLDRRGRLTGRFEPSTRLDEIGDLTRALRELARRLREQLGYVETFAGDLSHELKNPLASIRSATEMLTETDDPTERERFLGMVQGDVARMEKLLSKLREITTIDARLDDAELEQVDLGPIVEALVEAWGRRASAGVRVVARLPQERVSIVASPERIAQVAENLLDNALGFAPPGTDVIVALHRDGDEVSLTVSDSGTGLLQGQEERIFQRFYTYREGAERKSHSGLGLAIVKAIVESYGGQVSARNREGGGALFEVRLPVDAKPLPAVVASSEAAESQAIGT